MQPSASLDREGFTLVPHASQVDDVYDLGPDKQTYETEIVERVLAASERRAKDRIGELELVSWNSSHRWFYYPEMSRNEALLIKTFDSAGDGRARCSIHTAFHNPLAPPDAPARESMESRLLVFF